MVRGIMKKMISNEEVLNISKDAKAKAKRRQLTTFYFLIEVF
jgi:hypothetical protein